MKGVFLILLCGVAYSATLSTWKVKAAQPVLERLTLSSFLNKQVPRRKLFLGALFGSGNAQKKLERKLEVIKEDINTFQMKIDSQRELLKDLTDTREKVNDMNSKIACWDALVEGQMGDRVEELKKLEAWINGL